MLKRGSFLGGISLFAMILRAPEGVDGGGGGDGGTGGETKPAESILFPAENKPADPPAGDPPKEGDKPAGEGDKPADWKEYTNDPAKSEAENAAAKAEHDKTKPADDKAKGDADKVPDDGKYALTMPEGVEVDAELLEAVSPRFKELGLTRAQAQALTDDFIKVQQKRGEEYAAKPEGQWSMAAYTYFQAHGTPEKWADTAKADKDIGGTKWDATVQTSRRAVNTLGTPELKAYLEATGGGNHPELIRFMAKAGAMIKEDSPPVGGAEGGGKPAEAAHILFPSDAPKGK